MSYERTQQHHSATSMVSHMRPPLSITNLEFVGEVGVDVATLTDGLKAHVPHLCVEEDMWL